MLRALLLSTALVFGAGVAHASSWSADTSQVGEMKMCRLSYADFENGYVFSASANSMYPGVDIVLNISGRDTAAASMSFAKESKEFIFSKISYFFSVKSAGEEWKDLEGKLAEGEAMTLKIPGGMTESFSFTLTNADVAFSSFDKCYAQTKQ